VPNVVFAGSCNQLRHLTRDPFWSRSCCLQQAFTQVQSAQQASVVKQQLWREMQGCGILWKPVLSPVLPVLAPKVKKNTVVGVNSHAHKRNHHRGLWWFCYFGKPGRGRKIKYTLKSMYSFVQINHF